MPDRGDLVAELTDKRVLFVVAHQDDEALWFGGLLSRISAVSSVYLLCVTKPMSGRADTNTREDSQQRVCGIVRSQRVQGYFPDCGPTGGCGARSFDELYEFLRWFVVDRAAQVLVTHGEDGESCSVYPNGHAMHVVVYRAVRIAARALKIPMYCRKVGGVAEWTVDYNASNKKSLLDCYLPHWKPDGYPGVYDPEGYVCGY